MAGKAIISILCSAIKSFSNLLTYKFGMGQDICLNI